MNIASLPQLSLCFFALQRHHQVFVHSRYMFDMEFYEVQIGTNNSPNLVLGGTLPKSIQGNNNLLAFTYLERNKEGALASKVCRNHAVH